MKHEKEKREGEITDTADTSKHGKERQQGKAAQHRQIAEEPNMLWDYTVGLHVVPASISLQFVMFSIEDYIKISIYFL